MMKGALTLKEVSEQLSLVEFTAVCSVLDETYKSFTHFFVVKVRREYRLHVNVILPNDPTRVHEVDVTTYLERRGQAAQKEAA